MKRNLFLILLCATVYAFGQTTCLLDESVFSGTVTTTTVGATKFKASDATSNHRFGERVAIDANIAAVVSRSNGAAAGKVYIYTNDGSGNWTQQTILTASDSFSGDNFGSAVALEGNYLVVGARSQLNTTNVDTGAAYVFEYNGISTWTQVAKIEPSDGASGIRFGEAVSIEGDLILVGARNGCTGGCAYMYENDGTNTFTYTETKLEPQVQSNYSGARFGYDVLLKDGRAYVGGPQDYSSVGNASAGSVQIWDQANDGTWSRTHRLRGTQTSEYFGCSISVQGDYLAIGAYNFEVSSTPEADQGRVYVYKVDTNGDYLETNRVMIQNDDKDSYNDQRFGTDVVLDGDFLYAGTFGNGTSSTDAVYIFKDDGTNNWTQISKLTSGAGWDEFSNRAVAVSYPTLLIGQNEDDSPSNSGAVYFVSLESTITPTASVTGTTDVYIGQSNGTINVNFDDEATRSEIKFSIDGSATYPYIFNDDTGNAVLNNLAQGSYELRVAFEDGSCILDLGTVTINQLPYTAIPDANFEAALEALGYDDISSDGQVPTDYISGITSLDVSSQNISDLTGINDFVALEVLRLQYNNLTSLDVSNLANLRVLWAANGNVFNSIDVSNNLLLEDFRIRQYTGASINLSANTALTRFACESCDLLTVDTSNNINLSFLDLWNSDITSLDLSTNVNLATLDIYSTNITTLDLSANTALTNLIANDITTLTSIDVRNGNNVNINTFNVTNNSNLDCVLVDDATYSTTNWTQVDSGLTFSENYCRYTTITDANFEAALNTLGYDDIAADGQVPTQLIEVVTTLDVSNQNIADLTGIQDFIALTSLNVEDNVLTQLDVSNNANLQTLIFDNNTVSSLNLGTISNLDSIEGRYNQLTTIDVSQNTNLTFINLRDNLFTTVDVSNNPLLETINLRGCTNLTTIDLTNNINVKSLFFQDTALNGLDVSNNTLLENIIVERVNFNSIDVSNLPNLKQLRIADNSFTELDVSNNPALVRLECENNNLSFLNLKNGNNINMPNGDFKATGNPLLTCILVDDATWSTTNWTNIDPTTSFSNTYCRYTAIPDAVFEARLQALGYDDINGDGQVPTALIETVTYLFVPSGSLSDLTGIEDFLALETLICSGGNLTSVDLSTNTQLRVVNFSNNNINAINVSNSNALEELNLRGNNLTAIDVTNNVALTELDLSGSNISTIDLSNNALLTNLDLSNNAMTSLDITNNTALTNLEINSLNISSIDLSNNTLLEELICSYTALTSLNLSNNAAITYLECEESNQLTTLDLSALVVLDEVFLNDNILLSELNVKNDNNINMSSFEVTGSSNLTCIIVDDAAYSATNWTSIDPTTSFSDTYCRYTAIPDANFEAELETLGYDDISGDGQVPTVLIEGITSLAIPNKGINDLTGIEDFIALTSLNCRLNNLTALNVTQNVLLSTLTADSNNINVIDLSNNTDLQILNLAGSNLTTLDISNNTELRKLFVQGNGGLTSLDISNNTQLVEFRTNNTGITTLDLSVHPDLELLECYGSTLASIDLSNNPLLEVLRLENTNITSLDLTNNPNIISLRVNNTNLNYLNIQNGNNTNVTTFIADNNTNLACIFVDDAVYSTTNWTDVDPTVTFRDGDYCRYTAIPDANFEARLEALGYDDISGDGQVPTALIETVTTLDINSQNIADITGIEDFTALEELSAALNTFTSLDLSNNTAMRILLTKFTPIASLNISANTQLEQLVCSFNNLSSLDVSANTALTYLECNNNSIASLDVSTNTALLDLRCGNNALSSIDLTNNILLQTFWCDNNTITSLDLSQQSALTSFVANDNNLTYLNMQNGNNTNVTNFIVTNNASLSCILVDDAMYSTTNWLGIDVTTSFNDQYCRYTAIPDTNFEARLEALGYDDISADGQVPTVLIEVVTNLNLVNQGITDLTGIEDFIALTNLNVSDNTIGSLDMSNSPNLVTLTANACGLTNLDVSQNTTLENLSADSNQLTSINTSNNVALKSAILYGNLIAAADFSTNTLLENLDLFQNKLTTLDLSNNAVLKTLFCDNNELISLNIQNGNNVVITTFNAQNNDDLYCILVDDDAYSTTNWTNKDAQASYNETSCDFVIVDIDVFLQGALIDPNTGEETLMRDDLRIAGAVYDAISPYGDGATISLDVGVTDNGVNAMVDWIWVELRDAGSPTTVIAGKSGVLQRDGDIVDVNDDLVTPLTFNNVPAGDYFVVVKHRNHLGIMSANAISFKQIATTINFTDATNEITYGSNAQTTFGMPTNIVAMWAGNVNGDTVVQYSGVSPDTPDILSKVLNDAGNFLNFPTYVVSGYNLDDVNLDGNTQYSGTEPDTPFILQNVLAHPGNFLNFSTYQITEQLPDNE